MTVTIAGCLKLDFTMISFEYFGGITVAAITAVVST
jgi:hypothetical protein